MFDFFQKNKMTIAGGVAVLLLIYVYLAYFSGGYSSATLTSDDQSPLSSDILTTLQKIKSIQLDNSIFSDPVFISLTDFGVTIPPENVGRRNPFIPVGASSKTSASSTGTN